MPTTYSSSTIGLHEATDSQNNTRAQQTAMPQPAVQGVKRSVPGSGTIEMTRIACQQGLQDCDTASQPEPKRKTLAEKAGSEFANSKSQVVGIPTKRSVAKGSTLVEMVRL
jgi:hypothetical protein